MPTSARRASRRSESDKSLHTPDSVPWLIRPLAPAEVERVASVLGLARLDQGDGFYLVAWNGDEPVGHAHLALTDPPELQDVAVRREYRRRGVATALTDAAEHESTTRGFDRLQVTVSVQNGPARALYRSCGYDDVGIPPKRIRGTVHIRTGPIEVDDTLLTWEKRLTSAQPRVATRKSGGAR
jgi:ribosomal protein S18 acetylase RimI-like enzyme